MVLPGCQWRGKVQLLSYGHLGLMLSSQVIISAHSSLALKSTNFVEPYHPLLGSAVIAEL